MAQNFSGLICNLDNNILAQDIPVIFKENFWFIAFEKDEFEEFIFEALKSWKTNLDDYDNYDFIEIVKKLNIKDFIAYNTSDWADMPILEIQFAIRNNEINLSTIEYLNYDQEIYGVENIENLFIKIPENKIDAFEYLNFNKPECMYSWNNFENFKENWLKDK